MFGLFSLEGTNYSSISKLLVLSLLCRDLIHVGESIGIELDELGEERRSKATGSL